MCSDPPSGLGDTVYRDADYWMPDRANVNVNVRPFHDEGNWLNVTPMLDGGENEDEDEEARYDAWMSGCGVLITNIKKVNTCFSFTIGLLC